MITNLDRHKALIKRKLWDHFDWGYPGSGIGYFKNHRSLTCGCWMCQSCADEAKRKNKRSRLNARIELKNIES